MSDRIGNYSVEALVDDRGFVRDVTAEYEVVARNGTYDRRFEVTYDRLDRTTVGQGRQGTTCSPSSS